MSIAKKADNLAPWDANKGVSGFYGPNSVIYYQKTPDVAGYAYRAKSTYIASNIPPDEDSNWEIDYTYASAWRPDGKYKIGSRVYYFNGQYAYAYIASLRYFGGTGKPNEEVDEDNIRTWELEMDYYPDLYSSTNNKQTSFLFPIRKVAGYDGGTKAYPWSPLFSEERMIGRTYYDGQGNYNPINGDLDDYLWREDIVKKDYSDINSRYQSYAYDSRTYIFTEDKPVNGVYPPRKKGIHYAKWRRLNSVGSYTKENPNPYANAEYQHFWTGRYNWYNQAYPDYYERHGFSIDIWPNITESDYALVPTTSQFNYIWWMYYNYVSYSADVRFGGDDSGSYSLSLSGGWSIPDQYPQAPYPPDGIQCKASLLFYRQNPAFNDLNCTYFFNARTQKLKIDRYTNYGIDANGNPYFLSYGYNLVPDGEPEDKYIKESSTTKDDDFKCDVLYHDNIVRSTEKNNAVDFSGYRIPMTTVDIWYTGWRIE